tara:strand:- start:781 stop:957 length:177 start_codon:yes stop_codon:yes gene_type:complete
MKTFLIKGSVVNLYPAVIIEALDEFEAMEIYEGKLLSNQLEIESSNLEVWNEMETEEV